MADETRTGRRATLIVGYGAFGREVFERLLASAAPRGVLEWQEAEAGAGVGERSLRDLALLHVPDRIAVEATPGGAPRDAGAGLLDDLYRQIRVLEERSTPERDLTEAVTGIAERLLSATSRAGRRGALPLGLDVIVVAHPEAPEVLGVLDRMLAAAMDALANNANLVRAVQGAQPLSFLEVLDFENYWDGAEGGRGIRRAVASSLEQWERRRTAGRPAYGRVYLVDGRTADGIRDPRHRIDEIGLFLELLLFEGQRSGELQSLWQPAGSHESPLATFGVRLVERSAGLLSRLAGARFSVDWLEYLAGTEVSEGEPPPGELVRRLAPYHAGELEHLLGGDELRALLAGRLGVLESELLEFWRRSPERPGAVVERYQEAAREIAGELAREAGARRATLHRERLDRLREEVEAGVEGDLHHDRRPLPLGAVIRQLEAIAGELDRGARGRDARGRDARGDVGGDGAGELAEGAPEGGEEPLATARRRLGELADRFDRFRRRRVHPERLRQWWPLWAGALAAGATPIFHRLLGDVPPPDGTNFLLVQGYRLLQWIADPVALGVVLFAALWGLGSQLFQRRIEKLQERAEEFYLDPLRGRLADRLRAELAPDGALGGPLHRELEESLGDAALAVRGAVRRELRGVLERLQERRREMLWLRSEVRDFLTLHGLELTGDWHRLERQRRDGTGIRRSVENDRDLERMLERNPPVAERFRSTQADQRPFERWRARFCDAFLHPLPFLDRLSRSYDPAALRESGGLEEPGRDFLDFLARSGGFDLAFSWKAQEGVPADRRYCLLPEPWRRLPGVLPRLADLRITDDRVLGGPDEARAYLLWLQTGIDRGCLLEGRSPESRRVESGPVESHPTFGGPR